MNPERDATAKAKIREKLIAHDREDLDGLMGVTQGLRSPSTPQSAQTPTTEPSHSGARRARPTARSLKQSIFGALTSCAGFRKHGGALARHRVADAYTWESAVPRGVPVIADTREDALRLATEGFPGFRAVDAREIDLTGLPPLASGPIPTQWAVAVEHEDPEEEAKLPQDADPLGKAEHETRLLYLTMTVDSELLVTGVQEEFPCPACGKMAKLELPAPRDTRYPQNAQCSHCGAPVTRVRGQLTWDRITRKPKMGPRACIFCGKPANSYEHAIPRWIAKQLKIKTFLSATSTGGSVTPGKQPISFAGHRARIFCGECNTHFKHLEDEVIPLLVPMARGFHLALDLQTQGLLALWATKTAMALLAASDGLQDSVPVAHRRSVRDDAVVPDTVWVGFFVWRGDPTLAVGRFVSVDEMQNNAYLALLTFAGVGFSVVGFDRLLAQQAIDGDIPPFRQFWPPRTPLIHWPSTAAADRELVPALMRFVPLSQS